MGADLTFNQQMTARFLRGLLSTPSGRAHLLNQVADAEATDEGAIFERLLQHVTDPKLRHMIERHQADELRHAELFRGCLARQGVDPGPVPAHLRLLDRIDAHADHVMKKPVTSDEDVMVAYLMLLVIEERALNQFGEFIPAFDVFDPATADVFRQVARDEERHLKYCHAISRRYAPSEEVWRTELHRFRRLEGQAFAANSQANMAYVFEKDLHPAGTVERLLWRGVQALAVHSGRGPRTRFWGTTGSASLTEAAA
jgi:rubrerythrin